MKRWMLYAAALGATAVPATMAQGANMFFNQNQAYSSFQDSPFTSFASNNNMSFFLEDFEDGALNTLGISASAGSVFNAHAMVDSVDADDGQMDGTGTSGMSWKQAGNEGQLLTFTFNQGALGALPTRAGLVWTDGNPDALVRFEAFDGNGNSLGMIEANVGDAAFNGQTGEDRFFGIAFNGGIAAISIWHEFGGLEIDHIQYGFAASVIPLPPAAGLGLAGLGLIAWRRRRRAAA